MSAAGWANVIAVAALLLAGLSLWRAHKAERSAERAAIAQETLAEIAAEQHARALAAPRASWSIQHLGATRYLLKNDGPGVAYEVLVAAPGLARGPGGIPEPFVGATGHFDLDIQDPQGGVEIEISWLPAKGAGAREADVLTLPGP